MLARSTYRAAQARTFEIYAEQHRTGCQPDQANLS